LKSKSSKVYHQCLAAHVSKELKSLRKSLKLWKRQQMQKL